MSVLPYAQWQNWSYQPWATGLDTTTSAAAVTDDNLSIEKPIAVVATTTALPTNTYSNGTSGVGATLTAASNGALSTSYTDGQTVTVGDTILVKDEATQTKNGLYIITAKGDGSNPWVLTRHSEMNATHEFKGFVFIQTGTTNKNRIYLCPPNPIAVGDSPVVFYLWKNLWSSSQLPKGMYLSRATGKISGAAEEAGVYIVGLQASNDNGTLWSASAKITIGIDSRAAVVRSGADLFVDVRTGEVSTSLTGGGVVVGSTLYAKQDDDLLIYVHFHRSGTILDLGDIPELKFGLKEFDPESLIVLGGGTEDDIIEVGENPKFGKIGSGADTVYVCHAKFDGDLLRGSLSNYEDDAGTQFNGLGEIQWVEDNPTGFGPAEIRRSSVNFSVQVVRNLNE